MEQKHKPGKAIEESGQLRARIAELEKIISRQSSPAQSKFPDCCREFMDNSQDAIVIADPKSGLILDCNKRAGELWGRPCAEIIGERYLQLHPKEYRQECQRIFENCTQKNIPSFHDTAIQQKDGTQRWVNISCTTYEIHGKKYALGVFRDISKRKQVEEQLRQSEERFRILAETAQDHIFLMDKKGALLYINKAGARLFKKKPSELIGRHIKDVFPPEMYERRKKSIAEVFKSAKPRHIENSFSFFDQGVFLDTWLVPIEDADHGVISVYGISRDTTARKKTEELLRQSEERYRSFIDKFQGIAFQGTFDFRIIFMHGAVQQITGYKEEDFLNEKFTWREVVLPEDWPKIEEFTEKLRTVANYFVEQEYRIVRKDKSIRWVHEIIQNICDDAGKPHLLQGIIYDITRRRSLEEKARQNEELYHTLAEASQDFIFVMDKRGVLGYVNEYSAKQFKTTAQEAIGRNIDEFFTPEIAAVRRENAAKVAHSGQSLRSFDKIEVPSQGARYIDTLLVPLKNKDNQVTSIMGIARDITERRNEELALEESELQLREQKMELEQKNIALKEMFNQIEIERNRIKKQVVSNVETFMLPTLKKISVRKEFSPRYTQLMEHHLKELVGAFGIKITGDSFKLSPREIEICSMIKAGFSSKEIAEELHISRQTADRHRNNIRKKLGIVKKSVNLVSFLQSSRFSFS